MAFKKSMIKALKH